MRFRTSTFVMFFCQEMPRTRPEHHFKGICGRQISVVGRSAFEYIQHNTVSNIQCMVQLEAGIETATWVCSIHSFVRSFIRSLSLSAIATARHVDRSIARLWASVEDKPMCEQIGCIHCASGPLNGATSDPEESQLLQYRIRTGQLRPGQQVEARDVAK